MNNWNKAFLGDVLKIKHGFAFKGEYFSDSGEKILITPGNFYEKGGFKFTPGKEKFFLGEYPEEYMCEKGDLVVAMTEQAAGLLGSTAIVPESDKFLHNQRIGLISFDAKRCDKYFLYYLFQTKHVREQIANSSSGTKVKHTSPQKIYDVEVNLPPLEVQREISSFLHSIESKIILNNNYNEKLSDFLRLIYGYWFIQFNFINNTGRPYLNSGGKLVENDLLDRKVPEGWKAGQLGDLCELYQPQTISGKELVSHGDFFVFGANGVIGKYDRFNHEDEVVAVACRGASCGTLNMTMPNSWVTGNAMVAKPICEDVCNDFVLNLLHYSNLDRVISGSAQPQITRTNLSPIKVLLPPRDILKKYSEIAKPNRAMITRNRLENYKLEYLFDWYLPLLMNGQLSI